MRVVIRKGERYSGRKVTGGRAATTVKASRPKESSKPKWSILWQVILLNAPAAYFIYRGSLFLAALSFYSLLALLTGYHAIRHQILHVNALIVGCIPMLMLLRPLFYHNSISIIFAGVLIAWSISHPREILHLLKDRVLLPLCVLGFLYWWASFIATGFYATNLRLFELTLGACVVFLLGRFRSYLTPALWGIGASTTLIVAGLWRYGTERLGLAEVGRQPLGHPQQVGMAASLILILSLADKGRWLWLKGSAWRYVTAAGATALLLLSTSRTSWLLALTGPAVLLLMRGQRRYLIPAALIVIVTVGGVLASSRGDIILKYVDKVISPNRTMSQKTSGRLEMYEAFPDLFLQSPVWGWGPGAGGTVYHRSSGETMMLHSLFLHIGVELGIIGLALLIVFYAAVLHRAWVHRSFTGEVVPLAGALCVCIDALAHNSFNPLTGAYLGLALTDLSRCWVVRTVPSLPRRPGEMNESCALSS